MKLPWAVRNFIDDLKPRRVRHRGWTALRGLVHGWLNPYDFDFAYSLRALCWRLKHLERVLQTDTMHQDSGVYAQEIRRFLVLIGDWQDPFRVVPRNASVDAYMEAWWTDKACLHNDEVDQYYTTLHNVEENSWKAAWELYEQQARCWWC